MTPWMCSLHRDRDMADPNTWRVVLLGNAGSGKSSLANTLFGEANLFPVNHEPNICTSKTKTVNGRSIQLIDTPDFFNTDPRSTELSPELLKCITESAPGPHAFLLVLKMLRYTLLEQAVVALMLRYFSKDVLNYTTVVFTHGDLLPWRVNVKQWVRRNEELRNLVEACGGRCHVISNGHWNNRRQIEELLQTIDQTVSEHRGGHYGNELLDQISARIQHQERQVRGSSQNISPMEIQRRAKECVLTEMEGVSMVMGGLLGAYIGGIALTPMKSVLGTSWFWPCVGVVAGITLMGGLGGLMGLALAKRLSDSSLGPEEREAKAYIDGVDQLFRRLQEIRKNFKQSVTYF